MLPTKRWSDFFLYLARVFILLILLVVLMPKLVAFCNSWMSSLLHNDQRPFGTPLRVDAPIETNDYLTEIIVEKRCYILS